MASARAQLSKLFRHGELDLERKPLPPCDPKILWEYIRPTVGFACEPHPSFLRFWCRSFYWHGRVARLATNPDSTFILASLLPDIVRVPPYPGPRHPSILDFHNNHLVVTDGSQGPWDPRRYPQEYDPRRPWLGFHLMPLSGPGWEERPNFETREAPDFFDFSGIEEKSMSGGKWKIQKIEELLSHRSIVEKHLLLLLVDQQWDCTGALHEHFGPALPFFDELEIEVVKGWATWVDGRDAIGRTLRYICESLAIARWIHEVARQAQGGKRPTESGTKYMGVWIGSVNSKEAWEFLHNAGIPLFAVLPADKRLHIDRPTPPTAPLCADEKFRVDSFISSLPFKTLRPDPFSSQPPPCSSRVVSSPPVPLNQISFHIPDEITTLRPPGNRYDPPDGIRHRSKLPWTTYLFEETRINRSRDAMPSQDERKRLNRRWETILDRVTTPYNDSEGTDVSPRLQVHPIVQFLPLRNPGNFRKRVFIEESERIFFWPQLPALSSSDVNHEEGIYEYCHPVGENDFVLSGYPWPRINETHPPTDSDLDDIPQLTEGNWSRIYQANEPTKTQLEKLPPLVCRPPPALARAVNNKAGPSNNSAMQMRRRAPDDFSDEDDGFDAPLMDVELRPSTLASQDEFPVVRSTTHPASFSIKALGVVFLAKKSEALGTSSNISISALRTHQVPRERSNYSDDHRDDPSKGVSNRHRASRGHSPADGSRRRRRSRSRSPCRKTDEVRLERVSSSLSTLGRSEATRPAGRHSKSDRGCKPAVQLPTVDDSQNSELVSSPAKPRGKVKDVVNVGVLLGKHEAFGSRNNPTQGGSLDTSGSRNQVSASSVTWDCRLRARSWQKHNLCTSMAPRTRRSLLNAATLALPVSRHRLTCYPIRVYNVVSSSRDATKVVTQFLQLLEVHSFGDIIIISITVENDGLCTVDLGFRFADDALAFWAQDGFAFSNLYWNITPIGHLERYCFVLPPRSNSTPFEDRLSRLQDACRRERLVLEAGSAMNDFESTRCLRQMEAFLLDFRSSAAFNRHGIGSDPHTTYERPTGQPGVLIQPHPTAQNWDTSLVLEDWMRSWARPVQGEPRAPKAPGGPSTSTTNSGPEGPDMRAAARKQARRNTRLQAERKHKFWSPDVLRLPDVPTKSNSGQPGDFIQGFVDIWTWYTRCSSAIQQEMQARGITTGSNDETLNELPFPSDEEARKAASLRASFAGALRAFGPSQRIYKLFGKDYSAVMGAINSLPQERE